MTHEEFLEAGKLYSAIQLSRSEIKSLEGYRGKTKHVTIRFEGEARSYDGRGVVFFVEVKDAEAAKMADAEIDRRIAGWRRAIASACRRLAQLGCAPPEGATP